MFEARATFPEPAQQDSKEYRKKYKQIILDQFDDLLQHLSQEQKPAHEYSFWADHGFASDEIPKQIVIATSSERKIALFRLQFLLQARKAFPEVFQAFEHGTNPIYLYYFLRDVFENGNGECQESRLIGYFKGVSVVSQPSNGETHDLHATQTKEAVAKARWVIENPDIDTKNSVVFGFDTMDVAIRDMDELPILLSKPSSQANFPKTMWKEDQQLRDKYIQEYIQNNFPAGSWLTGVTAVALMDNTHAVSTGKTVLATEVNSEVLERVTHHLDHNASGFGAMQQLAFSSDNPNYSHLQFSRDFEEKLAELTAEQQSTVGFLILCQVLGAPVWMISELLKTHQLKKKNS